MCARMFRCWWRNTGKVCVRQQSALTLVRRPPVTALCSSTPCSFTSCHAAASTITSRLFCLALISVVSELSDITTFIVSFLLSCTWDTNAHCTCTYWFKISFVKLYGAVNCWFFKNFSGCVRPIRKIVDMYCNCNIWTGRYGYILDNCHFH